MINLDLSEYSVFEVLDRLQAEFTSATRVEKSHVRITDGRAYLVVNDDHYFEVPLDEELREKLYVLDGRYRNSTVDRDLLDKVTDRSMIYLSFKRYIDEKEKILQKEVAAMETLILMDLKNKLKKEDTPCLV